MIIYADTSFFLAEKIEQDLHHQRAVSLGEQFDGDDWIWCPLHGVEFFCAVRAVVHRDTQALPAHTARAAIFRMERDIRRGAVQERELALEASVAKTLELSAAHGWGRAHTPFAIWHVAAAWSFGSDQFVTFDERQGALARQAGLSVPKP